MKIGELFSNREGALYPKPWEILEAEISNARAQYPQHGGKYDDATLLAFRCRTLAKNLDERTAERDRWLKMAMEHCPPSAFEGDTAAREAE